MRRVAHQDLYTDEVAANLDDTVLDLGTFAEFYTSSYGGPANPALVFTAAGERSISEGDIFPNLGTLPEFQPAAAVAVAGDDTITRAEVPPANVLALGTGTPASETFTSAADPAHTAGVLLI